jgi:hypothetical protein
MIHFDLSVNQSIIDEHYKKLETYLKNKLHDSSINKQVKDFIQDNLKEIIISKPEELLKINKQFTTNTHYNLTTKRKVKNLFNYNYFSKKSDNGRYDAYDLANKLSIRSCLYCNRNYTLTVKRGNRKIDKITRPEFDHFFDKDENPLLALSIYNLIPSCKICNSTLKGRKKFNLNNNLHPYVDDVIKFYKYKYIPHDVKSILGGATNLAVEIEVNSGDSAIDKKIINTKEIFKLEEIFSSHSDELKDLFDIKHRFSDRYFEELFKKYNSLGLNYDDVYKVVFGSYYQEKDFSKRPFSKLKNDILKELGII